MSFVIECAIINNNHPPSSFLKQLSCTQYVISLTCHRSLGGIHETYAGTFWTDIVAFKQYSAPTLERKQLRPCKLVY